MDNIDIILEDIYTLDPSLRRRGEELRELVSRLLSVRPQVALDPTFVSELRERILQIPVATSSTLSPIQPSPRWWWFVMRAAPLGAIAVLLLILVPQTPRSVEEVTTAPYGEETGTQQLHMIEEAMPASDATSRDDSDASVNTRSMKAPSVSEEGGVDTSAADTFSLMAQPSSSLSVMPQPPTEVAVVETATLEQAGYIAVYTNNNGALDELLGVSTLLPQGSSFNVSVPLTRAMVNNEVLYATIHLDDGDGIFEPTRDNVVYDAAGMPLSVLFVASTEMTTEE